jgi:hypothetical protein
MKTIRFVVFLFSFPLATVSRGAATVWDGPPITFGKAPLTDWTLPQNQDRITPDVWLTRADTQGLFNIKTESFYTHLLSPAGTEWAFGTTANFASLTYTNWEAWTGGSPSGPPSVVGRNAVVHLIAGDIYADIKFTSWGGSGGGLSYVRSTAPVPEPGSLALLGAGACLLFSRRRR